MGRLKPGEQMMSLCTPLYNTPLFQHDVHLNHFIYVQIPLTDYLLVVKMEKSSFDSLFTYSPREPSPPASNVYSAYIRKIDNLFVAGKMEPIVRMYNPEDNNYLIMKRALEDYLLQHYFQKCACFMNFIICSEQDVY